MLIMAWDLLHLVSGLLLLAEQGENFFFLLFSKLVQLIFDLHVNVFLEHSIVFNFLQSCLIAVNLSLIATNGNIYIQFTPFANSVLKNCKSENFSI